MLISFIVPAHNEAKEIGKALKSILTAAKAVGIPFEVIVVNDASTDETPEIAQASGARVIDVQLRKISAVRNAGARQAKGDVFFFIDADTQISAPVIRAALDAIEHGAIGGGAWVRFGDPVSLFVRVAMTIFSFFYMGFLRWAAGCFVFTRRDAFQAVGGFDESLFATEEVALSMALKRQGRFVLLHESVTTSARKMRLYSSWNILPLLAHFFRYGPAFFRQRKGLEWWYEGKRE